MIPATILTRLRACPEALDWASCYTTPQAAWDACHRGDWLFWLLSRTGADRTQLVRAACAVARTALHHIPAGEDRPLLAIEAAERWADGMATAEEVRLAADAAASYADSYAAAARAADSAVDPAVDPAATATIYAADAALDAAAAVYAADTATYAVHSAAYAAAGAAGVWAASLANSAAIVRHHFPTPPGVPPEAP